MIRRLVVLVAALLLWSGSAQAQQQAAAEGDEIDEGVLSAKDRALYERQSASRGGYARVMFASAFGRGLRFNNPFRLRTKLGETAESVSLTAPYWDIGIAIGFGDPNGLQHGVNVHLSVATEGVDQQAISGGYLALFRGSLPVLGYGRIGPSILTAPDPNVGAELALGGAAFFTGALGVTAEVIGNLYYGAGTYDVEITTIPILSAHAGLIVDLEVLP